MNSDDDDDDDDRSFADERFDARERDVVKTSCRVPTDLPL